MDCIRWAFAVFILGLLARWYGRVVRSLSLFLLLALLVSACRVDLDELDIAGPVTGPASANSGVGSSDAGALPAVGPIPASSHWHAAYVVRVCDDVLAPFDSTNDPLGIHSHADGLMHVHPFFEESGYENARLELFADAMGFVLSDGELTLPGGGTWRDGDLCNGVPGRVFVDRWQSPDPESAVERIFVGLDELRYQADGELYQIAFAPADSFPVVPPATALLPEVSNLAPPPAPWVDVGGLDPNAGRAQTSIWKVAAVGAEPCGDAVPESVLSGVVRCFEVDGDKLRGADAVVSARAVSLNRQAAVELLMTPQLRARITQHFTQTTDPLALAIEIDGVVLTAPLIPRPPVSDRLVVSGGLSIESAERIVEIFNRQ